MHTLLRVTMTDVHSANSAITEGRLSSVFQKVSAMINPEASFFYSDHGNRAAIMVFDMKDAVMIPQIAEPFFTELNAKVEFLPAMNPTELMKGLESWKTQSDSTKPLS